MLPEENYFLIDTKIFSLKKLNWSIYHLKNFFINQFCLWIVNLCLKSYTFGLYFILYLHVWIRIRIRNTIRIHKAPEYGSNLDPDPEHWLWECKYKQQ